MRPIVKREKFEGAVRKEPKLARPKPGLADAATLDVIAQRAREQNFRTGLPHASRYVVTSAQNATPVHAGFLKALTAYCEYHKAELVVIPFRFRNPTSQWTEKNEDADWWDADLAAYLFGGRVSLNKNIGIFGDVKMQPTRSSPLSGLDAMSISSSAIFGHTKVELRTVPVPSHKLPKILTTTGAVTQRNYVDAVTSKVGEFHHSFSAVVVEIDGDSFFLRQLNGDRDTGEFTDLDKVYGSKVRNAPRASALILGDTHVGFVDPGVEAATFGAGGMVEVLKPEHLVFHDLLDGYSCNPHHEGNPMNAIAKRASGLDDVRKEVEQACAYVVSHTPKNCKACIVSSNHDDFLRRWIFSTDWRRDPVNAVTYLETALEMAKETRMGVSGAEYPSPLELWARRLMPDVLMLKSSFVLNDVELALHGDRGPNGARGSLKNLRRIGSKVVIGHSHSPGINEGGFQTGTSTLLQLEYNKGPSSWANAHVVLYASGKRSLLFTVNGNWRFRRD